MSNVNEYSEYKRDADSFAILNTDTLAFNTYKVERERIIKIDHLAKDVSNLQKDLGDIKMLLQQLVNGKTNG
jgi:hypothetical protein